MITYLHNHLIYYKEDDVFESAPNDGIINRLQNIKN